MIRTLTIQNIALIEYASICFHDGMIVLSGETGAGKSIIVDAVALILGGRADKSLIRSGCERASVEAVFEGVSGYGFEKLLEREGIESNGDTAFLFREFSQNGRNICRINGVMVSAAVIKEAAAFLINLHGQSEHQLLADEDKQLTYLDQTGNETLHSLKERVKNAYALFIEKHRAYARLVKMNEGKERRSDQLKHELDELRRTGIKPGEEQYLSERVKQLTKASGIHEILSRTTDALGHGDEKGDSLHNLRDAEKGLRHLEKEDPEFGLIADQCENLYYSLEDILYRLETLNQKYDFDVSALENAENRLESVRKIIRKYGPTEEDVLQNATVMEKEYETLSELDEQLDITRKEHKILLAQYRNAARELTEARKKTAESFQAKMSYELHDLGMQQTVFKVSFAENKSGKPLMPSPEGDDRISFLFSPNPGEPMKPISKIASGGELSRLMLALKSLQSIRDGNQTMIFDEIDTGISGRIAQAVAEKLMRISMRQQVICISHLPQIAASADYQYLVHKGVRDMRTFTEIDELDPLQRAEEIARMISGAQGISEEARQYAGQLIADSLKRKKQLEA